MKINISIVSPQYDLKRSIELLEEYKKKGDKVNIAICKRNIKRFTKLIKTLNNK